MMPVRDSFDRFCGSPGPVPLRAGSALRISSHKEEALTSGWIRHGFRNSRRRTEARLSDMKTCRHNHAAYQTHMLLDFNVSSEKDTPSGTDMYWNHVFHFIHESAGSKQDLSYQRGLFGRALKKPSRKGGHEKRTWQLAIVAFAHYRRRYDA